MDLIKIHFGSSDAKVTRRQKLLSEKSGAGAAVRPTRIGSHEGNYRAAIRKPELESLHWGAFLGDFPPGASLYPTARPAKSQKPEEFVERMTELAATKLRSFKEVALRVRVAASLVAAYAGPALTGRPAARHSGKPSSSRRTLNPRTRSVATAS
jgi:hypothetical protein